MILKIIRILQKTALILSCALLLSSCATIKQTPMPGTHYLSWKARQAQLAEISSWYASGSLGITHDNHSDIATFSWEKNNNHYAINIHSPLNLKNVHISGNNANVTLWLSTTKQVSAKTPEELLQKQMGWMLPVSNLAYWIKGLPAPASNARKNITLDANNRLSELKQMGWQIQYTDFTSINGVDLPTKIRLQTRDFRMKLVIKEWKVS
jgi:outer membrane lipoprotein LolB